MADVNANIGVNIDASEALAQLKSLQRQISQFHSAVSKSSEAAALAQRDLQKNFINGVNSIGAFSAELRTVKTTAESFTNSLEKNKFSMREYFRYAGASTKTFGRLFQSEFDTVSKVAVENVKRLQTQYIKMGRDASGAMKAIAIMPTQLDMTNLSTKTQLAAQRQAIFNQLVKQGSTNLLNFGKNTQWAGRQLMVGFTLPLMALGSTATRTFMDMETAAIKFRKVYGDLFTPAAETQAALDNIEQLGLSFTKYGIAVSDTISLAAEAAAAGFQGVDLQRQTTEATRLQVLGQIDQQKALETTISLQNAFQMQSADLADAINFLNAVENQTVVSLDDITTAIPKAAPVVKQLGGDVKDLAFFMAAMKEGGINASEGANALKSGLASLINPTKKAKNMMLGFGIDIDTIVNKNAGNVKATVIEFAKALDGLSDLNRQRAIEQLFGKFQLARLSTLFENVTKNGNQASRVLDLANASAQDLAATAEKELGITSESAMNKFRASVEQLKASLAPIGEVFLQVVTPFIDKLGNLLDKFNELSPTAKKAVTKLVFIIGGIAPALVMIIGLIANFTAQGIKFLNNLRNGFLRLTGQSQVLGEQTQYLTTEQLDAAAAAHSLEQSHARLTQAFTVEAGAVAKLRKEYELALGAAGRFAMANPGMMMPGRRIKKYAKGIVSVPGPKGAGDVIPAMLSPGESVIPADMTKKYNGLISGMISDNIPGFQNGFQSKISSKILGQIPLFGEYAMRLQDPTENMKQRAGTTSLANVLAPLVARIGESRGMVPSQSRITSGKFDPIIEEYTGITQNFVNQVNKNFNETYSTIENSNERFSKSWMQAGRDMEKEVNAIKSEIDRGVIRKTFGLDPDIYSTIPTAPRTAGGNVPERARQGAFKKGKFGIRSYTGLRPGIKKLYERISGQSGALLQMGHVNKPQMADIKTLQQDPMASSSVRKAAQVMNMQAASITNQLIDTTEKTAQTKSPSKRTIKIGKDIARGLQVGMLSEVNKTAKAGQALSNAAINGTQSGRRRRVGTRAQGAPPSLPIGPQYGPAAPTRRDRTIGSVAGRFRGTSARVAARASGFGAKGALGASGLLYALSFLPGKLGEVASKASTASFALSGLSFLPGPLKLVGAGLLATYGIIKLVNIAREKEKQAIEGIGKAANLSAEQIKKLGEIYGFTPTISPLATAAPTVAVSPVQRTAIEQTKELMASDKEFQNNVKALKGATKEQADIIFRGMAIKLAGSGAPAEAIKNTIIALQEVAKRTDLVIDFKTLDLKTEEGQAGLAKNAKDLTDAFAKEFQKGYKKSITEYQREGSTVTLVNESLSNQLKTTATTAANAFAASLDGISNAFANGIIDAKQFNQSFETLSSSIKNLPQPASLYLMQQLLKTLPGDLAKSAEKIKDVSDQLLILKAAALGVAISQQSLDLLASDAVGFASLGKLAVRKSIEKQIKDRMEIVKKVIDEFNKENKGGAIGGAGSKQLTFFDTELNLLNKKRDALKEINDELDRQNQYQKKQMDLANQAKLAEISGNYIQAAMLRQQSIAEKVQYTRQSQEIQLSKLIDILSNRQEAAKKRGFANKKDKNIAKAIKEGKYENIFPLPKTPSVGLSLRAPGFKLGIDKVPYDMPAILHQGERVLTKEENKSYGNSSVAISPTFNITGGNSDEIVNKVMVKLNVLANKNNKSNRVVI